MKRRDEHALSPRRHNRQQLTRFSRPRTPRSQDDSAQASSSSVFVASAGFPTQTQQASTWMFAQQTVQNIHPQGQMDSNNWHMQGQVAGGQAYQWETNTQSNFGVPVPNQEGQFFMHENKNMQMQKCGNYYSSRNQESYVMHIRNLIHQYIFSLFFSTTASATLPLRFLFCCPSGTSFAQKTYGTRLYGLCSCSMESESDDDHPRLHISFTNPSMQSSFGTEVVDAGVTGSPRSPRQCSQLVEITSSPESAHEIIFSRPSASVDPDCERSRSRDQLRELRRAGVRLADDSTGSGPLVPLEDLASDADDALLITFNSFASSIRSITAALDDQRRLTDHQAAQFAEHDRTLEEHRAIAETRSAQSLERDNMFLNQRLDLLRAEEKSKALIMVSNRKLSAVGHPCIC